MGVVGLLLAAVLQVQAPAIVERIILRRRRELLIL